MTRRASPVLAGLVGAFGRIHGIRRDPERDVWTGAADPDRGGGAVSPSPGGSR